MSQKVTHQSTPKPRPYPLHHSSHNNSNRRRRRHRHRPYPRQTNRHGRFRRIQRSRRHRQNARRRHRTSRRTSLHRQRTTLSRNSRQHNSRRHRRSHTILHLTRQDSRTRYSSRTNSSSHRQHHLTRHDKRRPTTSTSHIQFRCHRRQQPHLSTNVSGHSLSQGRQRQSIRDRTRRQRRRQMSHLSRRRNNHTNRIISSLTTLRRRLQRMNRVKIRRRSLQSLTHNIQPKNSNSQTINLTRNRRIVRTITNRHSLVPNPLRHLRRLTLLLKNSTERRHMSTNSIIRHKVQNIHQRQNRISSIAPALRTNLPNSNNSNIKVITKSSLRISTLITRMHRHLLNPQTSIITRHSRRRQLRHVQRALLIHPHTKRMSSNSRARSLARRHNHLVKRIHTGSTLQNTRRRNSNHHHNQLTLLHITEHIYHADHYTRHSNTPFTLQQRQSSNLHNRATITNKHHKLPNVNNKTINARVNTRHHSNRIIILTNIRMNTRRHIKVLNNATLTRQRSPIRTRITIYRHTNLIRTRRIRVHRHLRQVSILRRSLNLHRTSRTNNRQRKSRRRRSLQRRTRRHHNKQRRNIMHTKIPRRRHLSRRRRTRQSSRRTNRPNSLTRQVRRLKIRTLLLTRLISRQVHMILITSIHRANMHTTKGRQATKVRLTTNNLISKITFTNRRQFISFRATISSRNIITSLLTKVRRRSVILSSITNLSNHLLTITRRRHIQLIRSHRLISRFLHLRFLRSTSSSIRSSSHSRRRIKMHTSHRRRCHCDRIRYIRRHTSILTRCHTYQFNSTSHPNFTLTSHTTFFSFEYDRSYRNFSYVKGLLEKTLGGHGTYLVRALSTQKPSQFHRIGTARDHLLSILFPVLTIGRRTLKRQIKCDNIVSRVVRACSRPPVNGGKDVILRVGSVSGRCGANSFMRGTLSSIDLGLHSDRFITVLNPSNSNGAALLGVVNNLSQCSDNSLVVGKISAGQCGSHS